MQNWTELFENYGIKTVSSTDREKSAYLPTAAQKFALTSAGLEPSFGEDKAVYTIGVLFDPALRSMQVSYYNSERTGSGRLPEARIGRGLPNWINVGDQIVIGNIGSRVFVAREPVLPLGQNFVVTESGERLTTEKGEYITVPTEPDVDELTRDLEAGRPTLMGSPAELRRRRELLDRIGELELELDRLRPSHGGIGHNKPPAGEELEAPAPEVLHLVADTAGVLRSELTKDEPDVLEVARAASTLRHVGHWLAGKGDVFAEEFAKAFGKSLGESAGKAVVLLMLITSIFTTVGVWLEAITWPF